MSVMQVSELTFNAFQEKMKQLGEISDKEFYAVTSSVGKHEIIRSKKKSDSLGLCQVFWRFLTVHEKFISYAKNGQSLTIIDKRIKSQCSQSDIKTHLLTLINNIFDKFSPLLQQPRQLLHLFNERFDSRNERFFTFRLVCKKLFNMLPLTELTHTPTFNNACSHSSIDVNALTAMIEKLHLHKQTATVTHLVHTYLPKGEAQLQIQFNSNLLLDDSYRRQFPQILRDSPVSPPLTSFGWNARSRKFVEIYNILVALKEKWPTLRTLQIGCDLSLFSESLNQPKDFIRAITSFRNLSKLSLEFHDKPQYSSVDLESLTQLSKLTTLSLAYISTGTFEFAQIIQKLPLLTHLSIIDSPYNEISTQAVQGTQNLSFLRIEGCFDVENPELYKAICNQKNLRSLILIAYDEWTKNLVDDRFFFGTIPLYEIKEITKKCTKLERLTLYSDGIDNKTTLQIGKLTSLTMLEVKITGVLLTDGLSSLLLLPKLKQLRLSINTLTLEEAYDPALLANSSISTLCLHINEDVFLAKETKSKLMQIVTALPKLTSLTLVMDQFDNSCISQLLGTTQKLEQITIVYSRKDIITNAFAYEALDQLAHITPNVSIEYLENFDAEGERRYTISWHKKLTVNY